jgi:hypothetical protein
MHPLQGFFVHHVAVLIKRRGFAEDLDEQLRLTDEVQVEKDADLEQDGKI